MHLSYKIQEHDTVKTVKELLKLKFELSDRLILKLKQRNCIFCNGKPVFVNFPIQIGDEVQISLEFEEDNTNIVPTKMELNILYEDEALLIINKTAGIAVHPSQLHYNDSLSNGVRYYFDQKLLKKKIRPVNRLDKNTSGIVIFAKNEYIQECLIKQMKQNQFYKEYLAICEGTLSKNNGTICAPISRKEGSIIERCVSQTGSSAITHYETIKNLENLSFVRCILETGRTHQIRVHLSYIGHPIIGDTLYGTKSNLISRQALHSYKVIFYHPINNKEMEIVAELPDDMKSLI